MVDPIWSALVLGMFSLGYVLGRQVTMIKNQICRQRSLEDLDKYYGGRDNGRQDYETRRDL